MDDREDWHTPQMEPLTDSASRADWPDVSSRNGDAAPSTPP